MRFSATILLSFAAAVLTEHTAHASDRSRVLKKGKKDKKSKGPTAEPTAEPTAAPLSAIELRYGPLASDELMGTYEEIPNALTRSTGINTLPNVNSRSFLRKFEESNGLGYTNEEFKRVCICACEEDPLCTTTLFYSLPGAKGMPNSDALRCLFFDPTLGPLYYSTTFMEFVEENYPDDPYFAYSEVSLFYKKGSPAPINFAAIGCDIPPAEAQLPAAVCLFTPPEQQPPECATLLTADYVQFIAPAMMCLAKTAAQTGQDPSAVIGSCLGCIVDKVALDDPANAWGASDVCRAWMDRTCNDDPEIPVAGFFGSNGSCSEFCSTSCTEELKTATVCAGGANRVYTTENFLDTSGDCIGRGIPGLADFTCPGEDFVAPTPEDWKNLANSIAA